MNCETHWSLKAACRGVEGALDIFFGDNVRLALTYCDRCPVVAPCLREALADPEYNQGVRGGTTHLERLRTGQSAAVVAKRRIERLRSERS